jgi:hypothetical protein
MKPIELPDPASVIPADWRTRSDEEKLAIYADAWSIIGANIAYREWEAAQPDWEQLMLPLPEFSEIRCASGWCAPSEPEYAWMEVAS